MLPRDGEIKLYIKPTYSKVGFVALDFVAIVSARRANSKHAEYD